MYWSETGPLVCVYTVLAGPSRLGCRAAGADAGVTPGHLQRRLLAGDEALAFLLMIGSSPAARVEAWRGWRSAFLFWVGCCSVLPWPSLGPGHAGPAFG